MIELWFNWWQEIINFILLGIILAIFFFKIAFSPPSLNLVGYYIATTLIIEIVATYTSLCFSEKI
jgi:hypothetical protein